MLNCSRRLGATLAGLTAVIALALPMAGTANAATTTLRLHTDADVSRFLADSASGLAEMAKNNSTDPAQKWVKTDTTSGFATYRNVKTGRCLTGRGIAGFPVVTVEACKAGELRQQWQLTVFKELKLRANGFVAEHHTIATGTGVRMDIFRNEVNQRWHTHSA